MEHSLLSFGPQYSTQIQKEPELLPFNPNNMNQDLRNFLVKNNAFSQFLKNIVESESELDINIDIDTAFQWNETPEGDDYWLNLSTEFDEWRDTNHD